MLTLKIIFLGILYIFSGGVLYPHRYRKNKIVVALTAIVTIAGTWYLGRDIYDDIVANVSADARQNSLNENPDATDIEILDFEVFRSDWDNVQNDTVRLGGRFLVNKKKIGDYNFCRMYVNYGHGPDDDGINPIYLYDTASGVKELEYTPADKNTLSQIDAFKDHRFKTFYFPDRVFDKKKAGTYWRKVSFVFDNKDKQICFMTLCGESESSNQCFPIK